MFARTGAARDIIADSMPLLSEWQTFFAVQAGAAATLTGLVFVAVSLNLSKIMTIAGLPGRAGESMIQLLQVFFVVTVP